MAEAPQTNGDIEEGRAVVAQSNVRRQAQVERIEGKVAQLLSERELVINRGFRDGVTLGMKFAVLTGHPLEIQDPDTHEVLATIDREKVRVKVTQVLDRAAVCKTYEFRMIEDSLRVLTLL